MWHRTPSVGEEPPHLPQLVDGRAQGTARAETGHVQTKAN